MVLQERDLPLVQKRYEKVLKGSIDPEHGDRSYTPLSLPTVIMLRKVWGSAQRFYCE